MDPQLNMLFSIVLMAGAFYFFMIRPNKKRMEKQKEMYDSLQVGDAVVTIGGLHGIIDEIINSNNTIVLDCEGIYLTFERHAIARVVTKGNGHLSKEEIVEEMSSNTPSATPEEENEDL